MLKRPLAIAAVAVTVMAFSAIVGYELLVAIRPFNHDGRFFQFGDEP